MGGGGCIGAIDKEGLSPGMQELKDLRNGREKGAYAGYCLWWRVEPLHLFLSLWVCRICLGLNVEVFKYNTHMSETKSVGKR